MKIYNKCFPLDTMITPTDNNWGFYPYNEYDIHDLCFFDIETTGLSPDAASIYLIGAGCYHNSEFKVTQWFADDYRSEKEILLSFLDFLTYYKVILQYNGNSFDIPFIRKKCKLHSVDCSILNEMKCIDLYVCLRRYGNMLGLPNKKLKSFERYIGLERDDVYDGGHLIKVYADYMQAKYLRKDNENLLDMLLLHNCEDITGLSQVSSLLFLKEISNIPLSAISIDYLTGDQDYLEVKFNCILPGDFTFNSESITSNPVNCYWAKNQLIMKIPVIKDTLRYYFSDYKDYYYMLEEKTVMHKSVAIYTDASVRRKAKKAECFIEKEGIFIPVNKPGCYSQEMHIFRYDYTSKENYIELTQDIMNCPKWFEQYVRNMGF